MHTIASIEEIRGRSRNRSRNGGEEGAPLPSARSRVRVTLEDGGSFIISSLKAYRLGLEQGGEISQEIYAGILQSLRTACMQKCGTLLGSRDYSVKRMRDKLRDAGYPACIIDEAVEKLERAGYLDDSRFAQSFVRSHIQDRSRLRMMRDLAEKGISEEVIEEALEAVGEEEDLEDAQREQIIRIFRKKGFDPDHADYEERAKIMAFLHRKGYPAEMIRRLAGRGQEW